MNTSLTKTLVRFNHIDGVYWCSKELTNKRDGSKTLRVHRVYSSNRGLVMLPGILYVPCYWSAKQDSVTPICAEPVLCE